MQTSWQMINGCGLSCMQAVLGAESSFEICHTSWKCYAKNSGTMQPWGCWDAVIPVHTKWWHLQNQIMPHLVCSWMTWADDVINSSTSTCRTAHHPACGHGHVTENKNNVLSTCLYKSAWCGLVARQEGDQSLRTVLRATLNEKRYTKGIIYDKLTFNL